MSPPRNTRDTRFIRYMAYTCEMVRRILTLISTEINTEEDLVPPGAKPGTIPTDVDQATGLERLELIGKMQGIDIFDMRPLDASRKGMPITFIFCETTLQCLGC